MYTRYIYRFDDSIEYEYKYVGNYGAKGEKRQKKEKATPEQIQKQNQYLKCKRVRHLIKANFSPGDYWVTLKYKRGKRPPLGQVIKDFRNFRERLRRQYKKAGHELKYIYRMEIGAQGGIHIHMLVNNIGSEKPITTQWERILDSAGVYFTHIYEEGGYEQLADYITKKPTKEVCEQLSMFTEAEQKEFITYGCSRNLVRPEPEKKEMHRMTMRSILENGPQPTEGFYIDKSSVRRGVNEITGYSYFYYTEYRIRGSDRCKKLGYT